MNTKLALATLALAAFTALGNGAQAQTLFSIGPYAHYDFDLEAASVGGQLRVGIPLLPVTIQPGVEVGLGDRASGNVYGELNLLYEIGSPFTVFFTPYVGAGAAVRSFENDATEERESELGLNLLGGVSLRVPAVPFTPFVQARYTIASEYSPLVVGGGLLFRFGGPL